jgi:hypothetical protein
MEPKAPKAMTNPVDPKYAKAVSAKQIKKALLKARGKAPPSLPAEIQYAAKWTQEMAGARESARELWEAYVSQDPEIFDVAVKQVGLNASAFRLAMQLAHEAPSPSSSSKLGKASASRYSAVKAELLADWSALKAQGLEKSKPQFVKDWYNQRQWPAGSIEPKLETLERWLPKIKTKK